ncbi:MAG: thioredoxin family protein [Alphaproteobacteria bacterium]
MTPIFRGAAIALSTLALSAAAHALPQVGAEAPAFSGTTTTGETVSLSDFEGQKVVLEWTNHDCPFVVKHYGSNNMQTLQEQLTGEDVVWLTVISSAPGKQGHVSPEEADALTESRGAAPTHVILDESGEIGRAYNAKTTPEMFLIMPDQTLAYMGAIDSIRSARQSDIPKATNYLQAAYSEAKAGQPVTMAQTTPYGCSVKYDD